MNRSVNELCLIVAENIKILQKHIKNLAWRKDYFIYYQISRPDLIFDGRSECLKNFIAVLYLFFLMKEILNVVKCNKK